MSEKIASAIKTLLDALSPEERARVLRQVSESVARIETPRAGDVLGTIVRLLPRKQSWTVEGIKQDVAEAGVHTSPKAIYNAMAYLVRKGLVQRVGYGQYYIRDYGFEIETSDDLGVEPSHHDE